MVNHVIKFTRDITFGSLVTILIMILLSGEAYLFYDSVISKVTEAKQSQKINREAIEKLTQELAAYKTWSFDQAISLQKDLKSLQVEIEHIKTELQGKSK